MTRQEIQEVSSRLPANVPPTTISKRMEGLVLGSQYPYRRTPVLTPADPEELFRFLWAQGIPVIIKSVNVKGNWSPEQLAQTHGKDVVSVTDS